MPPRMNRRGSAALTMLDSQSLEPRLESVLASVNPPSEDAAYQVVDAVTTAAIWRSHQVVLEKISRACGAQQTTLGLVRLMAMTNEFLDRDHPDGGPTTASLEGDEPVPCHIDVRARGRVGTHCWTLTQPDGDGFSDDTISDGDASCVSTSGGTVTGERSSTNKRQSRGVEGSGSFETLADLPLPAAINIKKGVNRGRSMSRHGSGMMTTPTSEGPSTARSQASSAKSVVHPAMARLFDMADRRDVGWLNVTDLQARVFLEYHGHKQWANPAFIRATLVTLDISKGGNEPINRHHFVRFLLFLMRKDPLMEFAARPIPPDKWSIGVPEQARELAEILKEIASRSRTKPVAARRRLNRALTSKQVLGQQNAPAAQVSTAAGGEDGTTGDAFVKGLDRSSHQVSPQVNVRDRVGYRRPSTSPAGVVAFSQRQHQHQQQKGGKRGRLSGGGGGGGGGGVEKGLEAFLHLDYTVQASLVETVANVRPGVTVQEMGFPEEGGVDGSGEPEVIRMKAGPADLQLPGRLSRSAYKALSRSRTARELPMGLDRSPTASTAVGTDGTNGTARLGGAGMNHPLKNGVARIRRPSTAPMGLHGFFGSDEGPDPRLLGGSKASTGYDGDEGRDNDDRDFDGGHGRRLSASVSDNALLSSLRSRGGTGPDGGDDQGGVPPIFAGEDIGSSSIPGGGSGLKPHALIPRGARPASHASGATRARVSSPGLGVRGEKRGGRAVAAW
ncbi:unnamed protein product [Ectocarpus sp. 8 AP-2014]